MRLLKKGAEPLRPPISSCSSDGSKGSSLGCQKFWGCGDFLLRNFDSFDGRDVCSSPTMTILSGLAIRLLKRDREGWFD